MINDVCKAAIAKLGGESLEILLWSLFWSLKNLTFSQRYDQCIFKKPLISMLLHKIQYFLDSIATVSYSLTARLCEVLLAPPVLRFCHDL